MNWIDLILIPLIKIVLLIVVLLTGFAYMTYVERKLVGRFQVRYGPNRAGPYGILQPIADALKMIFKEEIIPSKVDRPAYLLAPILALAPGLLVVAVIPFGPSFSLFDHQITLYVADVNIALLYVLAVASLGIYGIVLGGWSSNNNYSLLGSLRTSAQMVSYELPIGIFLASILLIGGTLRLTEMVETPRAWWQWLWLWLAFPFFFICMLAETNRSPFDLPETENELVAGFQTEYGGIKF
ncbi:MAG TPA: NADH-quinone oxidoreductase subunit H, partial [Anaerolineae bacterium]|nr:NADH-quinone oxidoreductase subunit H [Anaerolineae bacterium]